MNVKKYFVFTWDGGMSLTIPEAKLKELGVHRFIESNPRPVRCNCLVYTEASNGRHYIRPNGVRSYLHPSAPQEEGVTYYHFHIETLDIDKVL